MRWTENAGDKVEGLVALTGSAGSSPVSGISYRNVLGRAVAANMTTPDPLAAPDRSAAIVGIRLVVLDVIVSAQPGAPTRCRAGGTCGNVLAALAYLGWTSYPIARLGDDPAGRALANDLARWGVR